MTQPSNDKFPPTHADSLDDGLGKGQLSNSEDFCATQQESLLSACRQALSHSALIGQQGRLTGVQEKAGEEGEEVETRSGTSSHSAGLRGVHSVAVETQWHRELREERVKNECLHNRLQLLRQELSYWQHHTAQLCSLPLLLQPLLFHESSFLRSLQGSLHYLVEEVEQWQVQASPAWLRTVDRWRLTASRAVPGALVKVWGSVAVKLHLPSSGVDVVVSQSGFGESETLELIRKQCQLEGIPAELVPNRSPPLLKVYLQTVNLHVSVLSPAHKGFERTSFLRNTLKASPALRPVYLTLKHLWSQCGLLETTAGGPGAYGLFVLTAAVNCRETGSAAYLVYRFLQYYACECDYLQAVCLTNAQIPLASPALTVLDPSCPYLNVTEEADLDCFVVRAK